MTDGRAILRIRERLPANQVELLIERRSASRRRPCRLSDEI